GAVNGSLSTLWTDGTDLVVYADREGDGSVTYCELSPPYSTLSVGDDDLTVDLTRRGVKSRKGVVISSEALTVTGVEDASWKPLAPGHLLVVRQGAVR